MTNEQLFELMQKEFARIDKKFEEVDDQFARMFTYMQNKFDEIDKKIDDNHNIVMSHIDSLSGSLSRIEDELTVVGYKVTRLEEWVTAFKF